MAVQLGYAASGAFPELLRIYQPLGDRLKQRKVRR
jgi:hypothetical protein